MPFKQGTTTTGMAEGRLFDYIQRLHRLREGRTAVHIHISLLSAEHRRQHNLRIAAQTFDNLLVLFEGEMFVLSNNDIFFIAEGAPRLQIERCIERLRQLFIEDPLVYAPSDEAHSFCTWYDLENEYPKLHTLSKRLMQDAASYLVEKPDTLSLKPLDTKALARLDDVLQKADITNFVRNQTVCAYIKGTITPIFDELYVSIDDLQKTLLPARNLRANQWLFQYVTEMLDQRMFAYLAKDERRHDRTFSINLNLSTVLSPEFEAYDKALSASARNGSMVIEIQKHDIFADMGAFTFAQQYLHDRNHKLCLDGITHLTLPYIDREQLKLDLVKLCWSSEMLEKRTRMLDHLRPYVEKIGPERMILVHCDGPEALDLGTELGIFMFQGRYVTHLMQRARKPSFLAAASA